MSVPVDSRRGGPPVIGLVGGVGAGKSVVAGMLEDLGCLVSDSDRDARTTLEDPGVLQVLRSWWGDGVITAEGVADRSAIAARIFEDPEQRVRLEGLLHPRIHELRKSRFAAAPSEIKAFVIDAPLLFEAGLDAECDAVLFVDSPIERRLERVVAVRGWDESDLHRREDAQLPIEEKRRRATGVVPNTGTRTELQERVGQALELILKTTESARNRL